MTTSGTNTFNLNLNDLVEEAFERCGAELRTGYDLRTARRSLNLLTIEWANRGINLWTVDTATVPLISGTYVYTLPIDTIDLLDVIVRNNSATVSQSDIPLTRITVDSYSASPNKLATGRPLQVYINRQSGATDPTTGLASPTMTLWPVPDQTSVYTLVYWRLRRIQDAGNGVNTQDIPFRFLPAMTAVLAYHLAFKVPGGLDRLQILKADYDEQWQNASDEDRDKSSLRIAPRISY